MQQFLQFITWRLFTAQRVSGILTPIIKSSTTAVAASGFTFGALSSFWAPDDGREDARNTLSCKQMSSNKLEKLLHLVGWFIRIAEIYFKEVNRFIEKQDSLYNHHFSSCTLLASR